MGVDHLFVIMVRLLHDNKRNLDLSGVRPAVPEGKYLTQNPDGPSDLIQSFTHDFRFCWRSHVAAIAKATKGEIGVSAGRSPTIQSKIRNRLIAAAVAICCNLVLGRPM